MNGETYYMEELTIGIEGVAVWWMVTTAMLKDIGF